MTDYYSSTINKLDFEAESRMIQDMSNKEATNNRRDQLINKIKQIENKNLTNLEKLNNLGENVEKVLLNESVYKDDFCFLVENKKTSLIGFFLFGSSIDANENKIKIIKNG